MTALHAEDAEQFGQMKDIKMQTWFESYKGYGLICTPQPLADGRFGAKLVIERDLRSEMQEFEVGVKPDVFNSEEDAANASRIAGRQWVDERG